MSQYRVTEANGRSYVITANSHYEAWEKARRHATFQVQLVEPIMTRAIPEEYDILEMYDSHPGDPNNFGDHD